MFAWLQLGLGFVLLLPFFVLLCWLRFIASPGSPKFNLQLTLISLLTSLIACGLGTQLATGPVHGALWPQIVGAMCAFASFLTVFFSGWAARGIQPANSSVKF
jgi:hypothetical protein